MTAANISHCMIYLMVENTNIRMKRISRKMIITPTITTVFLERNKNGNRQHIAIITRYMICFANKGSSLDGLPACHLSFFCCLSGISVSGIVFMDCVYMMLKYQESAEIPVL